MFFKKGGRSCAGWSNCVEQNKESGIGAPPATLLPRKDPPPSLGALSPAPGWGGARSRLTPSSTFRESIMASMFRPRRVASLCVVLLTVGLCRVGLAEDSASAGEPAAVQPNMVGAYGPWLSEQVLGDGPARLSFRSGRWKSLDEWRGEARKRVWKRVAPVDQGGAPEVRVESTHEFDGLHVEILSWQLPGGPRTEAVLLKPSGAEGPLPAILGLHDHGGNKYLGWRKIARIDDEPWEIVVAHQDQYYEGVAWANEVAKRGYVVLVPRRLSVWEPPRPRGRRSAPHSRRRDRSRAE